MPAQRCPFHVLLQMGNGRTDTLSPGLIVVGVQVDVGKHVRLDVIVFDVEALLGFVIECHCARGRSRSTASSKALQILQGLVF